MVKASENSKNFFQFAVRNEGITDLNQLGITQ